MSITNPPTGASGPGSVGLGVARGSLKRSVQATFEGEFIPSTTIIRTTYYNFFLHTLSLLHIYLSYL